MSRRGWSCRSGYGWWPWTAPAAMALALTIGQSAAAAQPAASGQGERAPVTFDIAAQPLTSALHAFAETTGLQVSYPAELADGVSSPGVAGRYEPEAALRALLAGTGLTYRFTDAHTVTLVEGQSGSMMTPAPATPREGLAVPEPPRGGAGSPRFKAIKVPEIVVRESKEVGYKTDEEVSSPTRLPGPVRDLPQSVEVITRKLMDDQKAVRIQDVIRNVSGTFISSTGGGRQEFINIRGITSFADLNIFKNGFRDDSGFANRVFRETANLQRIEVLKGPASFLYGRAAPGGIMNLITKKPLEEPYYSADLIFGSYNLYRPSIDVSGPLNASKSLLYRFNGLYESGGSFRDGVKHDRVFAAPSFSWTLGSRTRLLFDMEYLYDDRVIDRGLPAIGRGVAPVPISTFLGDPNRRTEFHQGKAFLVLLHELSNNWTWRTGFRTAIASEAYDSIEQTGNATATGNIGLVRFEQPTTAQSHYLQNEVVGVFSTGWLGHRLLAGVEIGRERLDQTIVRTGFGTTNVFNPTRVFTPTTAAANIFDGYGVANFIAPYLVDQVALLDNLKLFLGGRFDIFKQEDVQGGVSTASVSENFFSPMLGVNYQPVKPVSLYANFSRSFAPQLGAITQDNQVIRPATGTQYEAGVKTELFDGRLFTNLAVFQITQRNLATFDPTDPTFRFSLPTGERRSQGVELDVAGRVMPGLDVIATYAYIDAENRSDDSVLGIASGNTLANAPLHSGSLWGTYTIQSGPLRNFGAGVGFYAAAKRLGDLQNTYEMPGYVRLDAALYYRKLEVFKRTNLTAALNFRNLLDHEYFEGSRENRREVYPGVPFTVLGSIRLEFY